MSKVLHITGRSLLDGRPHSIPQLDWVWGGGIRLDPGQEPGYMAGDRKSGLHRLVQRPHPSGLYVAPWIPPVVHSEVDSPPGGRENSTLGNRGILLERGATQLVNATNWDITNWTEGDIASNVGGQVSPTGETSGDGQGYLVTPSLVGGYVTVTITTPTNMNVDTYAFSVWVRKEFGESGPASVGLLNLVGVWTHVDLTDEWQRVVITSPNQNSTSASLFVAPGGDATHPTTYDTSSILIWAPQLENRGSIGGDTNVGATSAIGPSGTRVASVITADFAWPAPPWTFLMDYTSLAGSDSQPVYEIFRAFDVASTVVYRYFHEDSEAIFSLLHRDGTTDAIAIEPNPADIASRTRHRLVVTMDLDGVVKTSLDEQGLVTIGTNKYVAKSPSQLRLSHATDGGDFILHNFEIWDRIMELYSL